MKYDLEGNAAIVTAGTKGIGRGIVDLLLQQGVKVATCARNEKDLKELEKAHKDGVFTQVVDLIVENDVSSFVTNSISHYRKIDHFFYIAPNPPKHTLAKLSIEEWNQSYSGIIKNLVIACNVLVPTMKENGGGTITVVSSLTAMEPIDYLATSSVLRAGLPAWIKLMANEYGKYGIRVNAVMPGYTQTALLEEAAKIEAEKDKVSVDDIYHKWSSSFALRRVAKPKEIAHAALFLASPGASYITGTSLLVDGGAVKGI